MGASGIMYDMAYTLTPCAACGRHIRLSEASCPFCHAASSIIDVPSPRPVHARMGRAAMFAVGAAMLTMSGCDDGGPTALYGGPPITDSGPDDASSDASPDDASSDASPDDAMAGDDGGLMPAYGTPPPDGSVADAAGPADAGGAALYGAPPMRDGGGS